MKNLPIKQIITIAIIITLALIGYYFWTTSTPGYVKKYQKTIDSAQHNIDSLKTEIAKSDELIDSMNNELFILESKNNNLKQEIKNIQHDAKNKINAVDKLNNAELQHFFTERYK